jgi:alpha-tubulin suppressor-like RCC1 family protein
MVNLQARSLIMLVLSLGLFGGCATFDPPTPTPTPATFTITYAPNGGSGAPPIDGGAYTSGTSATVLAPGGLTRANHAFTGWNSQPDGSGVGYPVGSPITIGTSNITLHAIWRLQAASAQPAIALGAQSSGALLSDGTLYMWGDDGSGQLGLGGGAFFRLLPTPVPDFPPANTAITAIDFGVAHSAALLSDGSLYMWGFNGFGEIGDGTTIGRRTPTLVPAFVPANTSITAIALGNSHSAALLSDGSLYTWGSNAFGQLGLGDGVPEIVSVPTRVLDFPPANTSISAIALGGLHSAALLSDGSLYTWGWNAFGQLGLGDGVPEIVSGPTRVPNFPPGTASIATVALGSAHSAALLGDGSLYTWGSNDSGQLGLGDFGDRSAPALVPTFGSGGASIATIAMGGSHGVALLSDGSLYSWGWNGRRQLGIGDDTVGSANLPIRIPDFPPAGTGIAALAAGDSHNAALLGDGTLYAWGHNEFGQLGDGTFASRNTPTLVLGAFRVASHAD